MLALEIKARHCVQKKKKKSLASEITFLLQHISLSEFMELSEFP